jgi:hypothetical protein
MLRPRDPALFAELLWPKFIASGRSFYVSTPGGTDHTPPEGADDFALESDEWCQNHIHLLHEIFHLDVPYIEKPDGEALDQYHEDFVRAWEIAKELAHLWAEALLESFPGEEFVVVATKLDAPVVRFYRRRGDAKLGPPEEYFASMVADDTAYFLIAK